MTKENFVKYPRTMHLPWSEGNTSDDVKMSRREFDTKNYLSIERIIITEKMDGENTTMYRNGIHARSLDSANHKSRDFVKGIHSEIRYKIPENMRICGENMYAKHSIFYNELPSYFLVFGIWWGEKCLGWKEIEEWCYRLGLKTVPVLYEGWWDDELHGRVFTGVSQYGGEQEGYVMRTERGFWLDKFPCHVAKYVRQGHVQSSDHWMRQQIVPNKLKGSDL